ncbi:hypothetical protein GGR56DRAFT_550022 [Xylariaceae sp. FL0804]|nr:hypothetical protein GGR56DRAFT_550022 [Xylariaceae sp. FL0804]
MVDKSLLPANISLAAFNKLLNQYQPLLESLAAAKEVKPGEKSLLELDKFRYEDAVASFSSRRPQRRMTHDDVKALMEWKLRHGKFRPQLMKLISSNNAGTVEATIRVTMADYWDDQGTSNAFRTLCMLKGVGPATASLLLSVHDPDYSIFFSDEVFWWLCCGGNKSPIKYDTREYLKLRPVSWELSERLNVSKIDIEKVAYVVMREDPSGTPSATGQQVAQPQSKSVKAESQSPPPKRKAAAINTAADEHPPVRRSKRGKAS